MSCLPLGKHIPIDFTFTVKSAIQRKDRKNTNYRKALNRGRIPDKGPRPPPPLNMAGRWE